MNEVLKSAEMAPILQRFGYEAKIETPEEFKKFFAAELEKWPPVLKAAGIKPQ
jgi:tripartite-type tricarboxylate transporter receptor subunit TctC